MSFKILKCIIEHFTSYLPNYFHLSAHLLLLFRLESDSSLLPTRYLYITSDDIPSYHFQEKEKAILFSLTFFLTVLCYKKCLLITGFILHYLMCHFEYEYTHIHTCPCLSCYTVTSCK